MNDSSAKPPATSPARQPSDVLGTDESSTPTPHPRSVRSFVKRSGRITSGQQKARALIGADYLIEFDANKKISNELFNRATQPELLHSNRALILEIGFGMGEATAHIARELPQNNFICCEVHDPGVGALLKRIGESGIENIRIIQHDAVEVLEHMLLPYSLDGVHIFFPDPWHKKRHHKRRLIQAPFVKQICSRLKPGGYIHCATDWQEYAQQILFVLCEEQTLQNTSTDQSGYAVKPNYRPLTKFENRGLKLGHGVWDLVFKKI
jgi:tRNA (guanine-N7-)-methyltransferase